MTIIRLGVIGLSPGASWGFTAHLPAIRSLPDARIVAVATTRAETASRSAELAGAEAWFTDPADLATSPLVDAIVVTVKVPAHQQAVEAAIAAGKPVYCEWPLAPDSEKAAAWTAAAQAKGITTAIGLQAHCAAAVIELRDFIRQGLLGNIRSVVATAARRKGIGPASPASYGYTYDAGSRAGTREVLGGHLIGLVDHLVGIEGLTALSQPPYPREIRDDRGNLLTVTALDSFAACGRLTGGGLLSLAWWDRDPAPGTRITINGTLGSAELATASAGAKEDINPQITPLHARITLNDGGRHIVDPDPSCLPTPAQNLSVAYRFFLDDVRFRTQHSATFSQALRVHRLLDNGVPWHS